MPLITFVYLLTKPIMPHKFISLHHRPQTTNIWPLRFAALAKPTPIAGFMGPTWGPSRTDKVVFVRMLQSLVLLEWKIWYLSRNLPWCLLFITMDSTTLKIVLGCRSNIFYHKYYMLPFNQLFQRLWVMRKTITWHGMTIKPKWLLQMVWCLLSTMASEAIIYMQMQNSHGTPRSLSLRWKGLWGDCLQLFFY